MEGRQPQPQRKVTHPSETPTTHINACDLCYHKKIKCDGQAPRCSACVVYEADCTYKAASRKTPSRKQTAAQRQLREGALQSRIDILEGQLRTVLEKVERLERVQSLSTSEQDAAASLPQTVSEDAGQNQNVLNLPFLELPPYQDVLPFFEHYLATFNAVLPLFCPGTLMETVRSWYQNPHSKDPVIWALINVVLALAHHISRPGELTPIGNPATYLNNAQSVLTEVIMRDTDLVNVQVLLGLVILFWTADDLSPALILIATALRLAHKLGLHTRKRSQHLSLGAALQRNRVFWIAYILDRDISLFARQAPIQLDSDIDLDLPPFEAKDDLTGFVFAADGHAKLNFFRARVELARIQGKVYECVYSASSQNSTSEERARNVAHISSMLDCWTSQIPSEFHTATLLQTDAYGLSRHMCILYSTRLSCRALISFASTWDSFHYSKWIGRWQDYGGKVVAGQAVSHAPVPQGWQTLVDECREYMRLHATVSLKDTFFTLITLCAHNSSLISLTANSIFDAPHRLVESDKGLTRTAMLFLEDMTKQKGREQMQNMRDAVKQLECYADLISRKTNRSQLQPEMNAWDEASWCTFLRLLECQYVNEASLPDIDSC
ncbi:hypothetical protein FQN53_000737 [Emmonsiellopsis sp. PD_33]|nr:hypothetical protein FQN53_000737 [Emmonsiellopsis sp. PD_33]